MAAPKGWALAVLAMLGCSPNSPNGSPAYAGGAPAEGSGGVALFPGVGAADPAEEDAGAANCGSVVQRAELVVVTRTEYEPLAVFVMQDRSSSMGTDLGDPTRWPNAASALTAFALDPASEGIDLGIGFFPPLSNYEGDCWMGTDCGMPVAPIARLPENALAIEQALEAAAPNARDAPHLLTPTECALRGMVNTCIEHQSRQRHAAMRGRCMPRSVRR